MHLFKPGVCPTNKFFTKKHTYLLAAGGYAQVQVRSLRWISLYQSETDLPDGVFLRMPSWVSRLNVLFFVYEQYKKGAICTEENMVLDPLSLFSVRKTSFAFDDDLRLWSSIHFRNKRLETPSSMLAANSLFCLWESNPFTVAFAQERTWASRSYCTSYPAQWRGWYFGTEQTLGEPIMIMET